MDSRNEELCKWRSRDEKMTRSVDTLKELYTVAVGVALVMGVERLATESVGSSVFTSERFLLFLVLFVTLIPFYHGAFRHMDEVYIFAEPPDKRPGAGVLLADYLLLMCEAGLLVWLAIRISDPVTFRNGFLLLLSVDVTWAIVTWRFTSEKKGALKWGLLNLGVIGLLGLSFLCPSPISARYLLLIAVFRSVLDYWLSHKLYFPPA